MRGKIFNMVKPAKVRRSTFDLSHEVKLSAKIGQLLPVMCQEVVPGDKFKINSQSLIRLAPLVSPVMHRMDAYMHFFFVPNRILWSDWEKFITNEDDELVLPKIGFEALSVGSLGDYLGIPPGNYPESDLECNDLPFRAYYKIWNDYYRDQNQEAEKDIENLDWEDIAAVPQLRCFEKDYFTSALPWAQQGDPVKVGTVLSNRNPATLIPSNIAEGSLVNDSGILKTFDGDSTYVNTAVSSVQQIDIDVNEIRTAQRLQRWLERNARSGTRYVEHLLSHWGVVASDQRLQRAEYIGGGRSPVVISEVLATAADQAGTDFLPLGTMAGHGINVGVTNQASKYCEEHGFIMGILSVIPRTGYYQGLHRMFSREVNLDFYYPEFAQLGEQAVKNQEIRVEDNSGDNSIFGYQSRYAEYKYTPGSVHGLFRTDLKHWHLNRGFSSAPSLSPIFLHCDPDECDRIFAVADQDQLFIQLMHTVIATRPMPFFNEPGL